MNKIYAVSGNCKYSNMEVAVTLYTDMLSKFINSDNCVLLLDSGFSAEPILVEKKDVHWTRINQTDYTLEDFKEDFVVSNFQIVQIKDLHLFRKE
jgi:hypothetical protein